MKLHKALTNLEIVDLLKAVAASYQLKDPNKYRFQIIAYDRAADAVEHLSSEAKDLFDEGKLEDIPGVGKSIAGHLKDIFSTGTSKHFEDLMDGIPESLFEFIKIPGVGAKTAIKLAHHFGISKEQGSIKKLEEALKKYKGDELEGFGEKSRDAILKSIADSKGKVKRQLYPYARKIADEVIEWIKKDKSVEKLEALGSLRRKASTVGDIDIAVATNNPREVLEHFTHYPKATRTLEIGDRSSSIVLPGGIQVDLMACDPNTFGSMLQHFTGSKHHNIKIRTMALRNGLSVSDYGITELKKQGTEETRKQGNKEQKNEKTKEFKTEEEFYNFLGMDWIPPELREDGGEIELALENNLPKLIELNDIKADLHMHSNFDIETSHDLGQNSVDELIDKADSLGYEYIALTEHNPSQSGHSDKETIEILKRKRELVDKINESIKSIKGIRSIKKIFNSLEIDILPDGSLPVPADGLATLDFALVSIHSSFNKSRDEMTKRVLSALSQPKVLIFAHPTARKINEREGVELNWEVIFDFMVKNNKFAEINCDPMRLDLPDFLVHEGLKKGMKFTLGTDTHHKDMMDNMIYGIANARRGWAEKRDVVNCLSLEEFVKYLPN